MICPNCGRRNSAGATFCSRCRQRLPLATKITGGPRRAAMVEPRGGGGSGALVLAVALIAGFLFIGGAAAIYLSSPPADAGDTNLIGNGQATPTLPPFVQFTASPIPTPSPTFILLPSESLFPSPSSSDSVFVTPTPFVTAPPGGPTPTPRPTVRPTRTPDTGPTATPGPAQVVARFDWKQQGTTMTVDFTDTSKGNPTQWEWNFGDNSGPLPEQSQQNPTHIYAQFGTYQVKLTVTGPGGVGTKTKTVKVQAPPCDESGLPPGCIPTPPPSPTPSPSPTPTVTAVIPTETQTPLP